MKKVTSTELKNNTSEILNEVVYKNIPITVVRHNKVIAEIVPKNEKEENKKDLIEKLNKKYAGSSKSMPKLKKYRKNNIWTDIKSFYTK